MERRSAGRLAVIAIAIVAGACAAPVAPHWTYPPAGAGGGSGGTMMGSGGMPGMGNPSGATGPADPSGTNLAGAPVASGGTIEIHAFDLGFKPAQISVAAAGTYPVRFINDGALQHNVTFADGTKIVADGGQTTTGSVTVPAGGLTFICDIPGHAQAGMQGAIAIGAATTTASPAVTAATAGGLPAADPNAAAYTVLDPTAPAVLGGTIHDVDLPITERDMTVAAGYVMHVWTFGGTVPGPVIRVHLGDTVRVHLTNTTTMSHSIDFHASQTAMNDQMV